MGSRLRWKVTRALPWPQKAMERVLAPAGSPVLREPQAALCSASVRLTGLTTHVHTPSEDQHQCSVYIQNKEGNAS